MPTHLPFAQVLVIQAVRRVYVSDLEKYFVPEVKKRVAAETEHTIEFVEGYGGSIAGVAETLEAVQNGILDIGAYCFCFEPAKIVPAQFPVLRTVWSAGFCPTDAGDTRCLRQNAVAD